MTDVLFYDFDFNLLADLPRFISLNFNKNYCGFGTAELHLSLADAEVITLLENNPYLLFVSGGNAAIVTGWKVGEDIAIFGRTPEWLLTKRGVAQISQTSATPEVIAREAVSSAAGDFITLGDLAGVGTAQDYSTDKVRVLHDVVREVLKAQKLGFEVAPDIKAKRFVFRVFSGAERLTLLSMSSRTAYNMEYTVEKQDMATNSGWYERKFVDKGDWSASANSPALTSGKTENYFTYYKITTAGTRFGLSCTVGSYLYCDTTDGVWKMTANKPTTKWVYVDKSLKSGAKKWDVVLTGTKTGEEALAEIALKTRQESSSAKTKVVEYNTDYSLGDIVRVQLEYGNFKKSTRRRVAAVSIYYDVDKSGVDPTLESLEE